MSVRNTASRPFFTRAIAAQLDRGGAQLAENHRRLNTGVDQRGDLAQRTRRIGIPHGVHQRERALGFLLRDHHVLARAPP